MATDSTTDAIGISAAQGGRKEAAPQIAANHTEIGSREMFTLIRELVRPYKGWLVIVLIAMLLETAMSLASPWPLKVVIDSVLGSQPLPDWLRGFRDLSVRDSKMGPALLAGIGVVLIAVVGAVATYIDNYYTESVASGSRTTCAFAFMIICSVSRCPISISSRPEHCCPPSRAMWPPFKILPRATPSICWLTS